MRGHSVLIAVFVILSAHLAFAATQASPGAPRHPAVVADGALLNALRNEPACAERLELLRKIATTLTDQARQDPKLRQVADNVDMWMGRITTISLWAAVSENPAALEEARAWLVKALRTATDPNGEYDYGAYTQGLGTAYDLLWPQLDDAQRSATRDHLAASCRNLYLACKGEKPSWWRGLYLHHDLWIPTAGLGVGSAVLLGEVPEAKVWYDFAKSQFDTVFTFLGDDGGWTEGPAPWCYGVQAMVAFFDAVERVEGKGFADRPWLANTARYRLYTILGQRLPLRYAWIDDSHEDGRYGNRGSAAAPLLFWLAGRYGDHHAQWLALKEQQVDLNEFTSRKSDKAGIGTIVYTAGFGALWCNPALDAQQPPRHTSSVLFKNIGLAVARGGWTDADEVFTFQCGPLGGHIAADHMAQHPKDILGGSISHVHANANSITYYAAGRPWIIGPGYGFRDTGFQNTVMLETGSQTWAMQPGPKILRQELTDDHVYLLGDSTKAWPASAKIDLAWRHALWLPGTGVFLCDQLTTMDGDTRYSRRYDWQFYHPANLNVTRQKSTYRLTAQTDGPTLFIDLFTNGKPRFETSSLAMPDGYVRLKRQALELPGEVPPRCWIAAAIHMAAPPTATQGTVASQAAAPQSATSTNGPGWTALSLPGGRQTTVVVFVLNRQEMAKSLSKADQSGLRIPIPESVEKVDWWLVGMSPGEPVPLACSFSQAQALLQSAESATPLQASEAGVIHLAGSRIAP